MFLSPILILALLFSSCDDNSGKTEEKNPGIPAEATVTAKKIELSLKDAAKFADYAPEAEVPEAIVLTLGFQKSEPYDIGTFYGKLGTDGTVTFTLPEEGITATEEILEKPWSISGAWNDKNNVRAAIKAESEIAPEYDKDTETLKFSSSSLSLVAPVKITVKTPEGGLDTAAEDGTYTIKEDRSKVTGTDDKGQETGDSIFSLVDITISVSSGKATITSGTIYLGADKKQTDFAQDPESNNFLFSVDKDGSDYYDIWLTGGQYDGTADWTLTAISITKQPKATVEVKAADIAATALGEISETGTVTIEAVPSRAVGSGTSIKLDASSLFDSAKATIIVGGSEGSYTATISGTITLKAGKTQADLNNLEALVFDNITLGSTQYDNVILVTEEGYLGIGSEPFKVSKAIFTPKDTKTVKLAGSGIKASSKDGAHGTATVKSAPSGVHGISDASLLSGSDLTVIIGENGEGSAVSGTLTLAEGKTPYDLSGLYEIDFSGVKIDESETTYKLTLTGDYDGFSYEGKAEWTIEEITLKPETV